MRCLEREPDARYQNAYEILADLQGSNSMNMSRSGMSRSGISRGGSQSVIIQIPEFANRKWGWGVSGGFGVLMLALGIPRVRHLIPVLNKTSTTTADNSSASGIPPIS